MLGRRYSLLINESLQFVCYQEKKQKDSVIKECANHRFANFAPVEQVSNTGLRKDLRKEAYACMHVERLN